VATGAVAGGLQAMRARDMNLTYGPDGETLERAVLSGDAAIQLAGDAGKPGRRIAGEYIDVAFASAGEVTSLSARDRVELKIPSDADAPERVIRSTSMDGTGEAGKGLTGARFEGSVEFREARGPGQVRRARATVLDVSMAPGSGEIEDARFTGGTRFEDGALRASAKDGRYQIAKGVLELTGVENGVDPRVQDDHVAVDATRIDLTFEGTKLVATGQVRSLLKPAREARDRKSPRGPAATPKPATATAAAGKTAAGTHLTAKDAAGADGKPAQRVPGMLKDDKPVNVTSDTLDYDGGRSLATYTGKARLWQEETTITGETITIDDKSGDLKATGGAGLVRSAFTLEQTNAKTQAKEQVPSIATGKDLHYEDALRRATYTTEAHVNGPQGDCHAVKIEMYFADAGNTLERAEAYQQVKLLADQRTATGDRMTYFAADEKYLMTGKPVKTVDEECRETTGKTLTFWRSTDRIIVDGNEEIRTLTTNSAAPASGATATCTPARPR
jgi:lipopolysaccharide export system protein LptA